MPSNPLLHTDPNNYDLIDTFDVADTKYTNGGEPEWTGIERAVGLENRWQHQVTTIDHPYKITNAGSLIVSASSASQEVAQIENSPEVSNWYMEFSTLASGETLRFYVHKIPDLLLRTDNSFSALTINIKYEATFGTLNTRILGTVNKQNINSNVDEEHTAKITDPSARIGLHLSYDKSTHVVSLTLAGVTKSITLTEPVYSVLDDYVDVGFSLTAAKTVKIHDLRAW